MSVFWMVLGEGIPTRRHGDIHIAKQEAERLARKHPGVEFVVLQSIASVTKSDVTWKSHMAASECDIPF